MTTSVKTEYSSAREERERILKESRLLYHETADEALFQCAKALILSLRHKYECECTKLSRQGELTPIKEWFGGRHLFYWSQFKQIMYPYVLTLAKKQALVDRLNKDSSTHGLPSIRCGHIAGGVYFSND